MVAANPASTRKDPIEANPTAGAEPALDVMTGKSLELLTAITGPGKHRTRATGFYLQVEIASIDKRDHVSQPCEQIGETVNRDNAVRVALDFAAKNKATLVIVTGNPVEAAL